MGTLRPPSDVRVRSFLCPLLYFNKTLLYKSSFLGGGGRLVLEGFVSLHGTIRLQLIQHYWLVIDLDYCDIEWFALEMNRDHSVIFEIASKYCISDSFVDSEGYSISSKGFLPTVVDIMIT